MRRKTREIPKFCLIVENTDLDPDAHQKPHRKLDWMGSMRISHIRWAPSRWGLQESRRCARRRCCCSRLASSAFCTFLFGLWLVHVAVPMSPEEIHYSRCCFFLCHLVLELSLQDSTRSPRNEAHRIVV